MNSTAVVTSTSLSTPDTQTRDSVPVTPSPLGPGNLSRVLVLTEGEVQRSGRGREYRTFSLSLLHRRAQVHFPSETGEQGSVHHRRPLCEYPGVLPSPNLPHLNPRRIESFSPLNCPSPGKPRSGKCPSFPCDPQPRPESGRPLGFEDEDSPQSLR